MATTALTLGAERWLDEVILLANMPADVAIGNMDESFALPAGLGDVALMSALVRVTTIGTVPVTATFPRGVVMNITSPDGVNIIDVVGTGSWVATEGIAAAFTSLAAYLDPDALVLWRQTELLRVRAPELDAGATGDAIVIVKCVRVRPIEAPATNVIQLVR